MTERYVKAKIVVGSIRKISNRVFEIACPWGYTLDSTEEDANRTSVFLKKLFVFERDFGNLDKSILDKYTI